MSTTTGAVIWKNIIEPEKDDLPPVTARYILKMDFRNSDHKRMEKLSNKAQKGTLTAAEPLAAVPYKIELNPGVLFRDVPTLPDPQLERRLDLREGIAKYLAKEIGNLTVEKRVLEFERADFKLSQTTAFSWRRNLPPLVATRTVFNYVATYNDYERSFAEFLDKAKDVASFASLGTTEQGDSGTQFRVDYLKPSGAIGFYHPDWAVVQKTAKGRVNWIIETKGREWEGTDAKDAAMDDWCERVSAQTGKRWRYKRLNQVQFEMRKPKTLQQAVEPESAALLLTK